MKETKLIFEKTTSGRKAYSLPKCDVPQDDITNLIHKQFIRQSDANLPEVSEVDVMRHFVSLSQKNYGLDSGFYPLGSCTMKYNPKINEAISRYKEFTNIHPCQPDETIGGCLEIMAETEKFLAEITGTDNVSLQPAAGAHGELTGLMIMKEYHLHNNQPERTKIIVPDSAHGTNPASASMVGFDIIQIKTNSQGVIDLAELSKVADHATAGLMLTNPSTLGIFEDQICEIADIIHKVGGLLYYDGANMNAIMGITSPGHMGFDVVHLNLHKTFSTPHGGGGPGSGPVCVKKELAKFLPTPVIKQTDGKYILDYDCPHSIGKVKSFYGNFSVILKAYCYILTMGAEGLTKASKIAVLNANYLMHKLKTFYNLPYDRICMHEFVLSGILQKKYHVSTMNIAKRLLDYGYHPPTVYFPLIVEEALMIEPTETESKETLDEFIDAMISIAKECEENPELLQNSPNTTPVKHIDEVGAARNPKLKYDCQTQE